MIEVGEKIVLSEDVDYYAITDKEVVVTFDANGNDSVVTTGYTCMIRNYENECSVSVPSFTAPDEFEVIGWSLDPDDHINELEADEVVV
jgi:hypothetical protein